MNAALLRRVLLANRSTLLGNRMPKTCRHLSTYYDSQSGMHVPIHKEGEITLILDKSKEDSSTSSFVPAQLYKEDPSSDMPDILKDLNKQGVAGVILPPVQFPRDQRNLKTLSAIAPKDFLFFSSMKDETAAASTPPGVSMIVDYAEDTDVISRLESLMKGRPSTTIALRSMGDIYANPIATANRVATVIDATGGGDFIWLSAHAGEDEDDVVRLCEELVYLDLKGKTVKARMIVNSSNEDVLEETMFSGVNKFVIASEEQVGVVEEMAKSQGKIILR